MTEEQWALEPHPIQFHYEADVRNRIRRDLVMAECPDSVLESAVESSFNRYNSGASYPLVAFWR